MQKTNSARTFDGPRKPRTKKNFGAPGSNVGASKKRAGGAPSHDSSDRPRGKGRGPSSYENAPSYNGPRTARPARDDSRGDRREGGYSRRDDDRGGYRGDRSADGAREGGYQRRDDRSGGYRGERPSYGGGREGGYQRRDNDFRPSAGGDRREGGYQRRDDRGGFRGDRPSAGGSREGGYQRRDDRSGGYRGERPSYGGAREGGYQRRDDDRGGFRGERREGGSWNSSAPRRDDRPAYDRGRDDHRDGGFRRDDRPSARPERRDGGYNADRREGGYQRRDDRSGGYRGERRDNDSRPQRDSARGGFRPGARDDRRDAPRSFRDDAPKAAFVPTEDVKLEKLTAVTEAAEIAGLGFGDLGLDPRIVDKLHAQGITEPFPIQAATIPDAVAGRNVLGRARTGSGKTVAYAAPALTRLLTLDPSNRQGRKARALILAPTRELAVQIDKVVQPLARTVGLFTIAVFGGVPQHKQATGLKRGVDIIIATPGRLEDLAAQGLIDLSAIRITIIDEADHMCELGFIEPVERILSAVNPNGQKMLYSATLDAEVASLVERYLSDAVVHEAEAMEDDRGSIDHQVLLIENRDKAEIVSELAANNPGRTVVFTRTRAYAEMLAEQLTDAGIGAAALHGDLKQAQRTRNLARLTRGNVDVLVATDVAARGIHVDDITLVIQADAPDEYKTYLHRSGRTGRAGADGVVVTLIPRGRRRRMSEMLERAEVTAPMREARPGDPLLAQFVQ